MSAPASGRPLTPLQVRLARFGRYLALADAFAGHPVRICYAVKANSNLAVLNLLARLGSGFDIVSVGELERVLAAVERWCAEAEQIRSASRESPVPLPADPVR